MNAGKLAEDCEALHAASHRLPGKIRQDHGRSADNAEMTAQGRNTALQTTA